MKPSAAFASLILTLALCGCGTSNSPSSPPPQSTSVLYATTANGMVAFTLDADGSLTSLPKPVNEAAGPAFASSGAFMFAGHSGVFGATVATLQPTFPSGALQFSAEADFPVIGGTTINALTTCGTHLFAAAVSGALVVYSVGSHGELTQASQVVGFAGVPWNMAVDKTCSYVYLSDTASANIYAFQYAGGFLSDLPGSPFPAGSAVLGKGLFGLSGDPAGRFLYVANQTEGKLYGFVIGSDGGLVPVPGSALPVGTTPVATLAVSVSSTSFLYVTDTTANNIASYRIDSNTGALSASSSATTRPGPQYLNSSGSLLFSANVQDSSIDAFHLNGDGTMTRVPGSPFALTSQPLGAAVVVTGRN